MTMELIPSTKDTGYFQWNPKHHLYSKHLYDAEWGREKLCRDYTAGELFNIPLLTQLHAFGYLVAHYPGLATTELLSSMPVRVSPRLRWWHYFMDEWGSVAPKKQLLEDGAWGNVSGLFHEFDHYCFHLSGQMRRQRMPKWPPWEAPLEERWASYRAYLSRPCEWSAFKLDVYDNLSGGCAPSMALVYMLAWHFDRVGDDVAGEVMVEMVEVALTAVDELVEEGWVDEEKMEHITAGDRCPGRAKEPLAC